MCRAIVSIMSDNRTRSTAGRQTIMSDNRTTVLQWRYALAWPGWRSRWAFTVVPCTVNAQQSKQGTGEEMATQTDDATQTVIINGQAYTRAAPQNPPQNPPQDQTQQQGQTNPAPVNHPPASPPAPPTAPPLAQDTSSLAGTVQAMGQQIAALPEQLVNALRESQSVPSQPAQPAVPAQPAQPGMQGPAQPATPAQPAQLAAQQPPGERQTSERRTFTQWWFGR